MSSWFSIVLAVLLAFILNSHVLPLTDVDEGAFSEATREMLAAGNLVSPTLNGEMRHDKPILIYWAQAASISLFGQSEFGFRLPSIIAAVLWLIAVCRFAKRYGDHQGAILAGLVMALSLMVGVVAKAAIADALLNLCICLAMFGIYDYFVAQCSSPQGFARTKKLNVIYVFLGLGFLTKGPVAVALPLMVGTIFFLAHGYWKAWARAIFHLPGWGLFLVFVLPWHVMVYLDQGDAFFRGFYLQHNLNRYSSTFEGHGGNPLYYLVALPFIILPFSGWLLAISSSLMRTVSSGKNLPAIHLERFLLIWFGVVFVVFSFSRTQLPHYLLYGCTPLFILLARYRLSDERRLLAFAPVLLFSLFLLLLPLIFKMLAWQPLKPFEMLILDGLAEQFSAGAGIVFSVFMLLLVGLYLWRRLPVWQALVIAGLLQAALVAGYIAPRILLVTQEPLREAAIVAREAGGEVVSYRLNQPSFSVYRQASTSSRLPRDGELVIFRADRRDELQGRLAPLALENIYQNRFVMLARATGQEMK